MYRYFPVRDKNLARRILRDGVRFAAEDEDAIDALRCFEELGILTSVERAYVKCSNENDPDFSTPGVGNCTGEISVHDNNEYYCPECGRPIGAIEQKQRFLEYRVSLNIDGIAQYIKNALQALAITEVVEQVSLFAFRVAIRNGNSLRVIIPNYADARNQSIGLFFAEPALYIISSPIYETVKTVLEERQYLELSELLSNSPELLSEKIEVAAIPIDGRKYLSETESRFDSILERHGKRYWQFFEQEFIPALVLHLTQHPELVQKYLDTLRRLSGTIFGEFYVPIGGAGRPDLRSISKFELMNQIISGNAIGEAKCHREAELTYKHVETVLLHLEKDRTSKMAIIIVANDKISSTAWDAVIDLRKPDGTWKIIIIPKYLLLELINAVDGEKLLD